MALYPPENLQAPNSPVGFGGGLCESKAAIEKGRAFPLEDALPHLLCKTKTKKPQPR